MEPHFIKGGKYEKWNPLFETLATFAFTPKLVTTKGTHIRDGVDLKRTMFTVVIALIPCLLFGIYNTGHWEYAVAEGNRDIPYFAEMGAKFLTGLTIVLPVVVVSYGVGLTIEFIFGMLRGHALHEGFFSVRYVNPINYACRCSIVDGSYCYSICCNYWKRNFGGTGMNVVNIALTARAFLFFAYPTSMSGDKVWMSGLSEKMSTNAADLDGFSGATALGDLASFMSDKATVAGETVQSSMALQNFSSEYGVWESFIGMIPGSIGETSTLACLIGGLLLVLTGVGSLRIILSFFAGGFIMGLLLNMIGGNAYLDLAAHHHLVIGGFAFGAVFMATDPVTASQTAFGKIIYGFLGGFLAIMIRVLNPAYPEGVFLAILFMNIMAPIIDHYIIQANINRRLKRLKTA